MTYYNKHIKKVKFYSINYRKINNVDDYEIFEKEVKKLLTSADKRQLYIDAKNMYNQSLEEKESNMTINFTLAISLAFGIATFILGMMEGEAFVEKVFISIAYIVCYFIGIVLFVNRSKDILKLSNDKIIFYETILRLISGN